MGLHAILRRIQREQAGQMMVMAAIMMPGIVGMAGLVLDGGFLYAESRRAQAAADASAMAGAAYIWKNTTANCSTSDTCGAKNYAETLGYTSTNATVAVTHPAESSGTYFSKDYATVGDYVKVSITYEAPKFFIGVVFPAMSTIQATAIAGIARVPSEFAMVALADPCPSGDVAIGGSANITINNGAVMTNCTSNNSVDLTGGSASITADAIQTSGGCNPSSLPCETGMAQIADPMGTLSYPCTTANTSTYTDYPCLYRTWAESGVNDNDHVVLNPGIWDSITPGGSAKVWFRQGVYVIRGSINTAGSTGLRTCGATGSPTGGAPSGDKGIITGEGGTFGCDSANGGVLIFIANSIYNPTEVLPCGVGGTSASMSLTGSAGFIINAMTTGPYNGLAVWQGCGNANSITLQGNSGSSVSGTTYSPAGAVTLTGSATWTTPSAVIASRFTASGSVDVTINYNRNVAYKPFNVVLVQ